MDTIELRNPDIYPSDEVIASVTGTSFGAYKAFLAQLKAQFPAIDVNWRYYNDGKSWLAKCAVKAKTVFWMSVWPGCAKLTFFFNPNTIGNVDEAVKAASEPVANVGKFIPLIFAIKDESILPTVMACITAKIVLK